MSGHQLKASDGPLGAPPTGGSGATNPERDLTIRIEALRAAVTIASGLKMDGETFAAVLRMHERYLRTGRLS